MKAHYMQYIVDLYGDAPYFEAFKDNKYNTTGFIDDAVIYKELVKELEARALIAGATSTTEGVTTDIVLVEIWLNGLN
jgi:hypothetical protein